MVVVIFGARNTRPKGPKTRPKRRSRVERREHISRSCGPPDKKIGLFATKRDLIVPVRVFTFEARKSTSAPFRQPWSVLMPDYQQAGDNSFNQRDFGVLEALKAPAIRLEIQSDLRDRG